MVNQLIEFGLCVYFLPQSILKQMVAHPYSLTDFDCIAIANATFMPFSGSLVFVFTDSIALHEQGYGIMPCFVYFITAMAIVSLYTDGACKGNPGVGGWGAILRYGMHEKELFGGEMLTTNNRMELTAIIQGLSALKRTCDVMIYTDSQYVKNGMETWIHNWKKNGWQTANKQAVKNEDLWKQLDDLVHQHHVQWVWVRGHAGHPENERADALANQGVAQIQSSTP